MEDARQFNEIFKLVQDIPARNETREPPHETGGCNHGTANT